jgi:hypothetical protein
MRFKKLSSAQPQCRQVLRRHAGSRSNYFLEVFRENILLSLWDCGAALGTSIFAGTQIVAAILTEARSTIVKAAMFQYQPANGRDSEYENQHPVRQDHAQLSNSQREARIGDVVIQMTKTSKAEKMVTPGKKQRVIPIIGRLLVRDQPLVHSLIISPSLLNPSLSFCRGSVGATSVVWFLYVGVVWVPSPSGSAGAEEVAAGLFRGVVRRRGTVSPWKPAAVGGATDYSKRA